MFYKAPSQQTHNLNTCHLVVHLAGTLSCARVKLSVQLQPIFWTEFDSDKSESPTHNILILGHQVVQRLFSPKLVIYKLGNQDVGWEYRLLLSDASSDLCPVWADTAVLILS